MRRDVIGCSLLFLGGAFEGVFLANSLFDVVVILIGNLIILTGILILATM